MRSIERWLCPILLLAAGLFVGDAVAEQGCSSGYIPTSTPSGIQCRPAPGLYRGPGNSPASQERWETRWGAIAMDNASGKTGIAGSKSTRRKAEQAALAQCKGKGGANCQVKLYYSNQCGALAWGSDRMVTARGVTLEEASKYATDQCEKETGDRCEVFFSDCSFPEKLR